MYIHLGYLRGQIRLRNPEICNNNDNMGSMLKHHRLKLNLTLEDGAEGICSISYLSKIENSLIRPSQKYLVQLEEKYNTSFQFVNTTHSELLHQLIENIFYGENERMDQPTFEDDNYQTKLNEYGYLVSQQNFEEARIKHFDLNPYIKNLNDLELRFYLYLTSKLLSHEGRIKEAFSILSISIDTLNNLFLRKLIKIEKISLATRMNHHPYISLKYEDLLDTLIENEFYHKVHEIKFNYLSYLVQFISESKLNELLNKSKHLEANQLTYLQAKYYFSNMHYEMTYDLLKNQSHDDIGTYEMTIMALNRMNNKKLLKEKLSNIPNIHNKHFKLIIRYLQIKSKNRVDIEEITDFIQAEVLKVNDLPDDIEYLNFWYEEGHQYFKKIGYYKDATTLGHLIFRKIKDLTIIFD